MSARSLMNVLTGTHPAPQDRHKSDGTRSCKKHRFSTLAVFATLGIGCTLTACKTLPPPASKAQTQAFPRPTTPPPAFKVFHHDASSITLVTKDNATDDEIESLIWQLRDAAHTGTFDKLNISQKLVDNRSPIIWFHIYRGTKCAPEKYASGPLPCGASYHAAGDFTFGGFTNHQHDQGVLLHDEAHPVQLWNPDAPYTASPNP